ncbi:MAG: PilW family protein [Betaproteobacteria bacterium]|nr:PilW family protein [Betaproteobacteria bacterium]
MRRIAAPGIPANFPPPIGNCRGLSLVELMVALTIGLILLAGVTTLLINSSNTRRELDRSTRQLENARYAQLVIGEDIAHAGYYGQYYEVPAPGEAGFPAGLVDPCSTTPATIQSTLSLPLQGYNDPATSPITGCLAAANHRAGTDILVVRRAETKTTAMGSVTVGEIYLQSNGIGMILAAGTATPASVFTLKKKDATTEADIRKFVTHIYFVSPCNVPASGSNCNGTTDDGGRSIPTLKRIELTASGGSATFATVPIAEGVENLQFDYGLDNVGTADGSPDAFAAAPSSTTDWNNVMAVRVNVLARNTEPTPGYTDTKSYTLGSVSVAADNAPYKRHVYSRLVRAVNPGSRREQ